MAGLVVDASVALAWALQGEAQAAAAREVLRQVVEHAAVVPAHWRLEVGNALLAGERRGRVLPGQVEAVMRQLAALPFETDAETNSRAWGAAAALARRYALTLYDAAYLELAIRRALPLASFDAALVRAAAALRVEVPGGEG